MDAPDESPDPRRAEPVSPGQRPAQNSATCPYCRAEVSPRARKCRFCGKWIEEDDRPRRRRRPPPRRKVPAAAWRLHSGWFC